MPENAKINSYIVSTYLAYGYPDHAYNYYKANMSLVSGGQLLAIQRNIFDDAFAKGNEARLKEMLDAIVEYYSKMLESSPYMYGQIMFYKSRFVQFYLNKNDNEKVVELSNEDFKWYEGARLEVENHKYWKNPGLKDAENAKKVFIATNFETSRLPHCQYLATALFRLDKKENLYDNFLSVVKALEAFDDGGDVRMGYQKHYQLLRAWNTGVAIASAIGDKEKQNEFAQNAKTASDKYQELLAELRKPAQQ